MPAVAGWGLHPLESATLSRRAPMADIELREGAYGEAVVPYPQGEVRSYCDWNGVRRKLWSPPVSRTASRTSTWLTIRIQYEAMFVRKRRAVVAHNLTGIVDPAGHRVGSLGDEVREIKHGHAALIP